ncbi:MAG: methyltransferase domain-containing protein [Alphaproteobacteria bacterium]|nr:methyltransferase domain-containing protein [Alphaproteobacteria bacterium]
MPDLLAPLREAARLRPDDADAHTRLGRAYLAHSRLAEAIEALQRAARLEPDDPAVRTDLGRAWIAAADPAKAAFHLRRAVALISARSQDGLDPDAAAGESPPPLNDCREDSLAAEARALLARAETGQPTLSADFVRELFDQYADKFDADMNALSYRAPDILRALFARVIEGRLGAPQEARVDILDLGCGTGLAGLAFRAFARTLTGVDLSPAMAAKARARGIYDRVVVGDMIEFARAAPAGFDLIVAADALGYVGDLAPLFAAARVALRPGGRFAATAEDGGAADFILGPARRFRHGEAYLRRTAEGAGFAVAALERCELRRDRGEPVAGLAFILDF